MILKALNDSLVEFWCLNVCWAKGFTFVTVDYSLTMENWFSQFEEFSDQIEISVERARTFRWDLKRKEKIPFMAENVLKNECLNTFVVGV